MTDSALASVQREQTPADLPVRMLPEDNLARPEIGIGLCLSGGGYRAMLFHLGALWRLHETGILFRLSRISSVSGGSITAGVLGLNWSRLTAGRIDPFRQFVVEPVRNLAGRTIDGPAIISGVLLPGSIGDKVTAAYDRHLFHGATLQALPDNPRFVINSTNVKSGALWRFSKPYMGDYRIGLVKNPEIPLAVAVAASSAFPPVLSPLTLELDPHTVEATPGADLTDFAYRSEAILTDGGVYDNLGLETVFKRLSTLLVSDGGQKMAPETEPKHDWARHAGRILELVDNQVRSLRKRQLIEALKLPMPQGRRGAYWGIRSHFADFGVSDPLGIAKKDPTHLADLKTRLRSIVPEVQEQLINWGYGICDAALRAHFDADLQRQFEIIMEPSAGLPYPDAAI